MSSTQALTTFCAQGVDEGQSVAISIICGSGMNQPPDDASLTLSASASSGHRTHTRSDEPVSRYAEEVPIFCTAYKGTRLAEIYLGTASTGTQELCQSLKGQSVAKVKEVLAQVLIIPVSCGFWLSSLRTVTESLNAPYGPKVLLSLSAS